MLRICNNCKTEFFVYPSAIKKGEGKYCSPKCYRQRNGQKKKIVCFECKKEFLVNPLKSRKYCSIPCYRKNFKSWNKTFIYVNCLTCQIKFKTIPAKIKEGKGKYCSLKCFRIFQDKNSWITKPCKNCGQEFKSRITLNQNVCGLKCRSQLVIKEKGFDKRKISSCRECGKKMLVGLARLRQNRGRFCSRLCYAEWMGKNLTGERSSQWKGGITPLYKSIRLLGKYCRWREAVKLRDKKCVDCGSEENLIADHIKGLAQIVKDNNIKTTLDANLCKELWDINNGRTLCEKCHKDTANYGVLGWV